MSYPRRHFDKQQQETRHNEWEEDVRSKAVRVIKRYEVALPDDRIWTETRRELSSLGVLSRYAHAALFHSLMLLPKRKWVTVSVHSTKAAQDR